MNGTQTYLKILRQIDHPEVEIIESPLLKDQKISFDPLNSIDKYFDKYINELLAIENELAFEHLDFSEITETEINYIKNLYNTKTDKQKQFIVLFLLLIVLKQNEYYDIFDSDGLHYNLLFNPLFLPPNPKEKCSKHLVLYINEFLFLEYKNHPTEILQSIISYLKIINNDNSIYNFLRFFIKLLQSENSELIQIFINSELFNKIIELSATEMPIFDFYRNIVYQYPEFAFQKVIVTQKMLEFFFDETRNTSIIEIFERAIEKLTNYTEILKEILIVFSFIILKAHEKGKEKSKLVFNLFSCIDNFFNIIPQKVDLSSFFVAVATLAVYSENDKSFELSIDIIRKLLIQRPSFIFQLKNQTDFFNILSKCKKKIDYKYLINLAKLSPDGMIHLYEIISVLLSLIDNISEDEENIASELVVLAQNSGNIIELDLAKVPEFILKRLPIIQEKEEICEIYLNLYSLITAKKFDKTTFLQTIELLKNSKFKHSNKILEILNKHLTTFLKNYTIENNNYLAFKYRKDQLLSHNQPFSFFRFDNKTGCGIICKKIELNLPLTFCFWLRINENNPEKAEPILFFENEKCKLCIYLKNNKVFVNDFELNHERIETGKWYFFYFLVERNIYNSIHITFNFSDENNQSFTSSSKTKIPFTLGEYDLHICRMPLKSETEFDHPSLICDISAFLLLNESVEFSNMRLRMIDILTSNELNNIPHLVCLFNPSQSQNNICFNVNKNMPQVPYSGRIIPIIPNFCDVMKNIEAIQMFLPLIHNLKDKKKLHLILSIFSGTISICEELFLKSRFFELLVSFLYHHELLIDKESFKDLLEMFLKIKNQDLQKSLLTSIYLNYKFLSNLFGSVESLFYTYSPIQLYQTKENGFKIVFDDLSLIIYTGVKYFNQIDDNSKYYWNYIKRLSLDSPSIKNIDFLIDFLNEDPKIKTEYVALNILDILLAVFEQENEIDEKYTDFYPYIITYSQYHESIDILRYVLLIMKTVSKKTNLNEKIYQAIYHLMIVFKPSPTIKQCQVETLIDLVLNQITQEEMISFTSFLPLFLKYSNSDFINRNKCDIFVNSEYVQKNISSIPFWTYWLTKLFLQCYNPNPTHEVIEFANLCIVCLKDSPKMVDLLNFFDVYNGLLSTKANETNYKYKNVNFTEVKENILIHLINNKKIDYSYVYNSMLYSVTAVKKAGNFPLSEFGEIIQELFSNFDITVSLRTTVNSALLDLMISKSQSILSMIVGTKVQLCGSKIEVPIKEVNTYLSSIRNNDQIEIESETVEEEEQIEKFTTISMKILNKCMKNYKESVEEKLKNNIKWSQDLKDTLSFERQYTESDSEAPIEYKLLFVFDLKKFNFYFVEKRDFIEELEMKYTNENNYLNKMMKSFMESISLLPGPWEDRNKNKKIKRFKILNRVSKTGKKILMRINKKFNNHLDASSNRVRNTFINDTSKLVYKPLETVPEQISKKGGFKAKIVILSQSKDEEGFLVANENCIALTTESSNKLIYWEDVEFILNRKEAHFENSIEIFKNNGRSYFITFIESERNYFYSYIDKLKLKIENDLLCSNKFDFFKALRICCNCIYQNKKSQQIAQEIDLINLWRKRKITTFSFLYYVNLLGGRSYNNIGEYIIYPFILSDVESDEISFSSEDIYRNFEIPIPAVSKEMLQIGLNRYDDIYDTQPYLFSELPSSSMVISWYLIRTEPFTTIHVTKDQQCGKYPKFDNPDRLFSSLRYLIDLMKDAGLTKEMIPEFFSFPFFLLNENHFDLGIKSNSEEVQEVQLPNWSRCCYSFISTLRLMLEGPISDSSIGKWIDLFFGTKRRIFDHNGRRYNLFKSYFYSETSDPSYKEEIIHCGSYPDQVFNEETPSREKEDIHTKTFETLTIPDKNFDPFDKAHFVKNILVCPGDSRAYEVCDSLNQIDLKNICGNVLCFSKSLRLIVYGTKADPFLTFFDLNTNETRIECRVPFIITTVHLTAGRFLITGGMDCSIRRWDLNGKNSKVIQISSSGFHTDHITAIGCCYDNGLLVSCDMKRTLIFETLIDHVFINSVNLNEIESKLSKIGMKNSDQLESESSSVDVENTDSDFEALDSKYNDIEFENLFSFTNNVDDFLNDVKIFNENKSKIDSDEIKIRVFKSGVVAVSSGSVLFLFDTRGKLMAVKCFDAEIIEIHKVYGPDTREFLIIGVKPNQIHVFDVAYLSLVGIYNTYFSSISLVQKNYSFITYYKGKVQTFDFSDFVSSMVSKIPCSSLICRSTYK